MAQCAGPPGLVELLGGERLGYLPETWQLSVGDFMGISLRCHGKFIGNFMFGNFPVSMVRGFDPEISWE